MSDDDALAVALAWLHEHQHEMVEMWVGAINLDRVLLRGDDPHAAGRVPPLRLEDDPGDEYTLRVFVEVSAISLRENGLSVRVVDDARLVLDLDGHRLEIERLDA